jgi:hypothetical protein
MLVAIAAVGLSGCAANAGSNKADAPLETPGPGISIPAPTGGDAILIETRITDAKLHEGEVLVGSLIGESPFCPGGETQGFSEGPTITTTITCPAGTLTIRYAPTQRSLVQSSDWEVVSGTGSYEGVGGSGSMVAAFDRNDSDSDREIFTGTINP